MTLMSALCERDETRVSGSGNLHTPDFRRLPGRLGKVLILPQGVMRRAGRPSVRVTAMTERILRSDALDTARSALLLTCRSRIESRLTEALGGRGFGGSSDRTARQRPGAVVSRVTRERRLG